MRKTLLWICGMSLLCAVVAGCDPVETELTVNSDGSGKMHQSVQLTPAALAILQEASALQVGYSPLLTEQAAREWQAAAGQGAVQLDSFSRTELPDGSAKIEVHVSFAGLSQFASSPWGFPLHLEAVQTDAGMKLSVSDPLQYLCATVAGNAAQEQMDFQDKATLRRLAVRELLEVLCQELRTRTVVQFAMEPRSVGGATLSADKRQATMERTVGKAPFTWDRYLTAAPLSAVLGPVIFKPFAASSSIYSPGKVVYETRDVTKEDGYTLLLSYVDFSTVRSVNFAEGGGALPVSSNRLNFNIQIFAPSNVYSAERGEYGPRTSLQPQALTIRDGQGNDLKVLDQQISLNSYRRMRGLRFRDGGDEEGPFCSPHISLLVPNADLDAISLLEGSVVVPVMQPGKMDLRPISAWLNRDVEFPFWTLRITSIKEKSVELIVVRTARMNREPVEWMEWKQAEGTPLPQPNWSTSNYSDNRMTYRVTFPVDVPQDGCLTVTYPAKIIDMRIPFSFKNITLP